MDGAQGNVTFYPTGTLAYKIMCQVAKGSMTLETELGLYVFSTAGSIEVGDNMKDSGVCLELCFSSWAVQGEWHSIDK